MYYDYRTVFFILMLLLFVIVLHLFCFASFCFSCVSSTPVFIHTRVDDPFLHDHVHTCTHGCIVAVYHQPSCLSTNNGQASCTGTQKQ